MSPSFPVFPLRPLIERLLVLEQQRQAAGVMWDARGLVEKLLATVDAAPVLLAYVDSEERYRFCNQRYEQWFGEPRERIIGRTLRDVLGDAAYEGLRAEIQAVLSGQSVRFERAVPYRSGGTRVVQADYLPHVLPDGRVAGYVGMVADVTELRQGEESARIARGLRESEDRLRLAIEATALGTWDVDVPSGRRSYSDRFLELMGVPGGHPFDPDVDLPACVHPEDRERMASVKRAAFDPAGDGRCRGEFRVVGLSGKEDRWLAVHGQVHFDARRRPLRFVGTLLDITGPRRARLRADRLFALSSALCGVLLPEQVVEVVVCQGAAALEALGASLVLLTEDGTTFEPRAAHGLPEGTLEGFQCFPVDAFVMYRDAVRTGRPALYGDRESFLRDHPTLRGPPALPGRAFAALPLQAEGRMLGAFGFTFAREQVFDAETLRFMEALGQQCALALVRARLYAAERQARAEAERLRDQLARERGVLEAVLDQLPVGVVIAEPGGRLVRGNAAVERLWGHPFIASPTISDYRAYQGAHPDGTPYHPEEWPISRSLTRGETVLREPVTLVHGSGDRRQLDVSSTLVRDAAGRPVAAVAVSVDVTAHHAMREALAREAEVRDRLMGIVGHDLRNPLQAIATSSALLLRDAASTPSQQKRAARILTSVRRMDHLIRDLMDFARVRREGTLPIQRRHVSLGDVCRIVIDELLAAYPDRDIHLDLFGDVEGYWDLDRLVQLLGNLVVNAFTHGAQGVPVEVRADGADDDVVLEVANAGKPIPPALLPRIFEPFTRADSGGDALKGVGLGLFIVHEIVTAHGGRVQVMSSMETGTVFRVTLPRVPPPSRS